MHGLTSREKAGVKNRQCKPRGRNAHANQAPTAARVKQAPNSSLRMPSRRILVSQLWRFFLFFKFVFFYQLTLQSTYIVLGIVAEDGGIPFGGWYPKFGVVSQIWRWYPKFRVVSQMLGWYPKCWCGIPNILGWYPKWYPKWLRNSNTLIWDTR